MNEHCISIDKMALLRLRRPLIRRRLNGIVIDKMAARSTRAAAILPTWRRMLNVCFVGGRRQRWTLAAPRTLTDATPPQVLCSQNNTVLRLNN